MPEPASAPPSSSGTRILLCGVGPLPVGNPERLFAPGLRVWGFAKALLAAGCAVDLLEFQFGRVDAAGAGRVHSLSLGEAADGRQGSGVDALGTRPILERVEGACGTGPSEAVRAWLGEHDCQALVSTTDVLNDACARSCGDLPLWCDFFGHPMAERQSMACALGSDGGLAAQWDCILAPLLRGDRFSGCSGAQRLALTGELGACGRLGRWTDGEELAVSLPPALTFESFGCARRVFRGTLVPEDAYAVLWSGGYNTWADPATLAEGLFGAMAAEPGLHFVSTGGGIAGHDSLTFKRFQDRIASSPFAPRFHFAGWVETRDVPGYYLESDLGLNCERRNLEGELGTRNRILDWIGAGLPVLTTDVCELTADLNRRGLVDVFACGAGDELSRRLIEAVQRPREAVQRRTQAARAHVLGHYAATVLFHPLQAWAVSPQRAGDLADGGVRIPGVPFAIPDNALSRRRASEWLASQGGEQAVGGRLRNLLGRLRR